MDTRKLSARDKIRQRAGGSREKTEKRDLIIEIAENLLQEREYNLPSVNEIIQASGIAKGTFYLYFKTKEEIYIALLKKYHHILFDELEENVDKAVSVNDFHLLATETMIAYAIKNPKAMYLAYIANVILENNIDQKTAIDFKNFSSERIDLLLKKIEVKFKQNTEQIRLNLIISYTLWLSLWQYANPPENIQALVEENVLQIHRAPFAESFALAMKKLWA